MLKSDLAIAQETPLEPIHSIAQEKLGISDEYLINYGQYKAKIDLAINEKIKNNPDGKLILVTAITPTPAGEGKTTTTIGLGEALNKLQKKALIAIREPSLGPCFGVKGGAAGGGYAQVIPMEDINLHFTGDLHAIGTAHNLLAAIIDNHLHQGNQLRIDAREVSWPRVVDMNDRALRNIVVGLGGKINGYPRETGYDITVASEVMASLCLATDLLNLRQKLQKIIIGFDLDQQPITAADLRAAGAMTVLLKDAIMPNLVQTLEHNPALIHGGPFANIAHGCNSLIATKLALKLAEYVITEAGFGFDLGGEKFLDIKCAYGKLKPAAIVLVATIRALKYHGGLSLDEIKMGKSSTEAVKAGLPNLIKHLENTKLFGVPVLVSINKFLADSPEEIQLVTDYCTANAIPIAINESWEKGGEGAKEMAEKLITLVSTTKSNYQPLYDWNKPIMEKIETIATKMYGAADVHYENLAKDQIAQATRIGLDKIPICIAKTQNSLSDNPRLLGAPSNYTLHVREVRLAAGAGFLVVLTGKVMTMPGLPKNPAALSIDIDEKGITKGLF